VKIHSGQWGRGKPIDIEIATETSVKKIGGTIGWGIAGGAAFGPIGLLAGLISGGRNQEITFVASFSDGNKVLATANKKEFVALKSASMTAANNLRLPIPPPPALVEQVQPELFVSDNSDVIDLVHKGLTEEGWTPNRMPRTIGQRHTLLLAVRREQKLAVACLPDQLNGYAFDQLQDALSVLEATTFKVFIGSDVAQNLVRYARANSVHVGSYTDLTSVLSRLPPF
jgi:hypothetical protein